jgi:hypothetical protein
MSYRWYICPVVPRNRPDPEGGDPDTTRVPKVNTHIEPGRGKEYQFSAAISTGNLALALVMADDFTALDADAECVHLLEANFTDLAHLDLTPRDLGWNNARLNRIKTRMAARGIDTTGITLDTPLRDILNLLCKLIAPFFDCRAIRLFRYTGPGVMQPHSLVSDTFTVGADAVLSDHVPDTGNQWVLVSQVTQTISTIAATDDIRGTGSGTNQGSLYKSQPDPSGADYDVVLVVNAVDTGTASRRVRMHGRLADAGNHYTVAFLPTGHASNDTELYKTVAGTPTSLASVDTGVTAADSFTLEIRDAAKRVLKNGAEILTSSDNAITAAGSAGVSMGKFISTASGANAGNTNTPWRWDTYSVTEAASTTPITGRDANAASGVGSLLGTGALAGRDAGAGTGAGALAGAGALLGICRASASAAGALSGLVFVEGQSAGASTGMADLLGQGALAGRVVGEASAEGALLGQGALVGQAFGEASGVAEFLGVGALAGNVFGTATTLGDLGALSADALFGRSASTSFGFGVLEGSGVLVGRGDGEASGSAFLLGTGSLFGQIFGEATGFGNLSGAAPAGEIFGASDGYAFAFGALTATGQLVGTSVSESSAFLTPLVAGVRMLTLWRHDAALTLETQSASLTFFEAAGRLTADDDN